MGKYFHLISFYLLGRLIEKKVVSVSKDQSTSAIGFQLPELYLFKWSSSITQQGLTRT